MVTLSRWADLKSIGSGFSVACSVHILQYMYGNNDRYGERKFVYQASRGGMIVSEKKISTTVYITREQSDKLKELHARTKVPVAEYIRQGIDKVLEENADKLPGQLSLVQ